MKDWFYNESAHVGVDYAQESNADSYDEQMESFRDYEVEVQAFVSKLGEVDPAELTVADIGCGTGAFVIHAAKYFKQVLAVDVSPAMQGIAKAKAETLGIRNIHFHQSGFLQFRPPAPVDVVFSKWALHHLPDFWKQAALLNINKMLKPGGVLFLADFMFGFDPDYEQSVDALLTQLGKNFDSDFIEETKMHIREEFSTFDWVLQGMLERAGFRIELANTTDKLASEYLCRKLSAFL